MYRRKLSHIEEEKGANVIDKEQLNYTIHQISQNRFLPYSMLNEELAEEMFPQIY